VLKLGPVVNSPHAPMTAHTGNPEHMCAWPRRRGPCHHAPGATGHRRCRSPHVQSPLSSCLHVLQFATAKLPREGTPLLPRCAPILLAPALLLSMPFDAAAPRAPMMTATTSTGEAPHALPIAVLVCALDSSQRRTATRSWSSA
jgi:hypothetical protein